MGEILDRYQAGRTPPPEGVVIPPTFGHIHFKAFRYIDVGPEQYRKEDPFGFPEEAWGLPALELLDIGCRQILQWKGFSQDDPLQDIGIEGLYRLIGLFHFRSTMQSSLGARGEAMLDKIDIKHVIKGDTLSLYNLVKPEPLESFF